MLGIQDRWISPGRPAEERTQVDEVGSRTEHRLIVIKPTWRRLRSPAKGALVALVAFVAVFIFRLGYFIPLVVVAGVVAAVLSTRGAGQPFSAQAREAGLGVFGFVLATLALYGGLTNRDSRRTFEMSWREGAANADGESEVILTFAKFPGNEVGVYSTALRDQLRRRGNRRIEAEFEVTSDLGCVRGFRQTRIADVSDPAILLQRDGYFRRSGDALTPWGSLHWWCP